MQKVSQVCADCGCGLRTKGFIGESGLCSVCKRRLISEVNTPVMDKAISLLFVAAIVATIAWVIF